MNSNGHKERPILFSGEMIRAILEGRKTQTRRVLREQPMMYVAPDSDNTFLFVNHSGNGAVSPIGHKWIQCPYGKPGDRLWVRETLYAYGHYRETGNLTDGGMPETEFVDFTLTTGHGTTYIHSADTEIRVEPDKFSTGWHKRPSIFMPRELSRVTLEITNIRVERLQEISEADVLAEGIDMRPPLGQDVLDAKWDGSLFQWRFKKGWDSLNAKRGYGWDTNPFVWVVEFKKL